jgi:phage terminase large subunit-like protein
MSRKPHVAKNGYWFDQRAANAAISFFENVLVHVKGEWAGKAFVLEDWQRDEIIGPLFGWRRSDGTRRYRTAYIEIPRKNGKSTLAAGIALYLLYVNDIDPDTGKLAPEPGAEVYSAAADKKQAGIVFKLAKKMVEASPHLLPISNVFKGSITVRDDSVYEVLSADVPTKHGLNASGVIFDELHAQPNRELWDVLLTSTGSRRQPLVVAITTAGFDRESICWEEHEYAREVLKGIITQEQDGSFFAYIRAAGEDDDWLDEEVWKKANPGLGVTIKLDYLRTEAERAKQAPGYANTFQRLHLDRWTSQETRWLPMETWDRCGIEIDLAGLEGRECYGGLDLATTSDLAAFLLDFPPVEDGDPHIWLPHFWIPKANMIERARRDRVPYDLWVRQGLITATEGNAIDYAFIAKDVEELGKRFNIREIAFDRWGAFQMSQQLEGIGFSMIAFGQGFVSMSPPMAELLRLVLDDKLRHGGNPVLRWMADNLAVSQDPAGNVKPDKKKSRQKIDGMVAGVMALDRAVRHGQGEPGSVYEERGLRLL